MKINLTKGQVLAVDFMTAYWELKIKLHSFLTSAYTHTHTHTHIYIYIYVYLFVCFPVVTTHCGCINLLVFEVSWSHNDAPQSVRILWTSDQSVAETCTWQHTTLTTDKHPCPSGIRTHYLSRWAVEDLSLRPRGQWDRPRQYIYIYIYIHLIFCYFMICVMVHHVNSAADVKTFISLSSCRTKVQFWHQCRSLDSAIYDIPCNFNRTIFP